MNTGEGDMDVIAAGGSVLVSGLDTGRADAVAAAVHGDVVPAENAFETGCDVVSPCATGGVLSTETASRLSCRIVAGSTNNQLAQPEAAEVLQTRGILYAPDYVINSGGAIGLAGLEQLGWRQPELDAGLARIGETLEEVYRRAEAQGISTSAAAEALAAERISGSDKP